MSAIRVLSPGLHTTVQDLGRFGWAHFGISASGAADPFALRAGNLLVGNAENAAALEMTLLRRQLRVRKHMPSSRSPARISAPALPLWTPVEIEGRRRRCAARPASRRALLSRASAADSACPK